MDQSDSGKAKPQKTARHILLLDDELAVRQALSRLLKALGYQCTVASIGEEILAFVESSHDTETHYDLAILDIKIPNGLGGIETMLGMQQLGSSIPVVSMSGYSTQEVFNDPEVRKGFAGHLQKPFGKDELIAEIERVCIAPSGGLQDGLQ